MNYEIAQRIKEIKNLPTLPSIATEILRIVRDEDITINKILEVIEKDPPLAMKVLRVANSAYYGLRYGVKSLKHAIVLLGFNEISRIAIAFSIIKILTPSGKHKINWRQLWKHSIACGYIAQTLADRVGVPVHSGIYSHGLLHDIGKIVLYRIDEKRFIEAFEETSDTDKIGAEIEKKYLRISHDQAGELIAQEWNLPEEFVIIIGKHHEIDKIENIYMKDIASIINLADYLANRIELGFMSTNILNDTKSINYLKERFDVLEDISLNDLEEDIQLSLEKIKDFIQQEEI